MGGEREIAPAAISSRKPLPHDVSPVDLPVGVLVSAVDHPCELPWLLKFRSDKVERVLLSRGVVLFRGFSALTPGQLEAIVNELGAKPMSYSERSTPRSKISGSVYSSTEYHPALRIPMHSEMSYTNRWPSKLMFYCSVAATRGGETPIAYSSDILNCLGPEIVGEFKARQIKYVRNFGIGSDLSWQETFQTDDKGTVELTCRRRGISFEWVSPSHLRTSQVLPAIRRHPITKQEVWFNQANVFHHSNVPEEIKAVSDEPSRAVYYGDGGEIEDAVLETIEVAFLKCRYDVSWREGDMLLIDNMQVAHGRMPYVGERKLQVLLLE